jgi:outer membrane protein assembly factor BamB
VKVRNQTTGLNQLRALDEATGAELWTVDLPNTVIWCGPAYDSGRVFVVRIDGLVEAVDAASGTVAWTKQLIGNNTVTLPPVATGGTLFVQAGGVGGTIYAFAVADGAVKWTANTNDSGPTSPAVSSTALYASFACARVYAFSPATGAQFWFRSSSCSGGGGTTPVLTGGRLYSRDNVVGNLILDAGNAANLGSFAGFQIPAFDASTGYYLNGSFLEARDINSGALKWSFSGDGTLSTAPIIDNGYVYVGAQSGKFYALNATTGANVWTGNAGAPMIGSDTIGLAAGEGILVVPATNLLVAYQAAPPNPIDQAAFFVNQHYLDFLNRQPDPSGLAFWTNEITSCGLDQTCIDAKRVNVSAAYFLSIEFQQTGYLVERIYKSAYGDAIGNSTFGGLHTIPIPIIRLNELLPDTQKIGLGVIVGQAGWEQALENNKVAFTSEFVQRSRFTSAYPTSLTPTQFVDRLFGNAGVLPSPSDRSAAINEFGVALNTTDIVARARTLRRVAENATLLTNESNRAFVLMQYFGYLRRNPNDPSDTDYTGYDFWLTKLNQFNGNFVNAEMVKAFIVSGEYRGRFGP